MRRLGWIRQITVSAPGQCLLDKSIGCFGHIDCKRSDQCRLTDQYRRRHIATPVLGIQQPLHCLSAERVHADSVDGVGRKHDALAILDGLPRSLTRFRVARRIVAGAVESPISEIDSRLCRLPRVRFAGHAGRGHRSILPELPASSRGSDKITSETSGQL